MLDGNDVIYSEPDIHIFIPKGKHNWQWDGFSNQGILDTSILKSQNLTLQLTAINNAEIKIFKLKLKNKAAHVDWLDARFDRNKQEVKIEIRPQVSDGGVEGGVEGSNRFVPIFGYDKLKEITQEAIGYFWSRDGSRGDINSPIVTPMGSYKVTVSAKLNKNPHMSADFDLIEKLDNDFGRSTSLWAFRSIYFNRGIYANDRALLLFRQTAAHEVGHIVLNEASKPLIPEYSWRHKGSSTLITQEPLEGNPVPAHGEVDLMKYYTIGTTHPKNLTRNVASERDVLGLIWLLGVKFDD